MSGIEKHTGTYDENLTDIRNLKPLTIALAAILAVWSILYLIGLPTPSSNAQTGFSLANSAQPCRPSVSDPGPHTWLRSPALNSAKANWAAAGFVPSR
ncbi:MAG TPA: hypothetical protein VKG91_19080 [Roseiarcus sp.]|nr:hypothetical protein [Roseiarcus sp.]